MLNQSIGLTFVGSRKPSLQQSWVAIVDGSVEPIPLDIPLAPCLSTANVETDGEQRVKGLRL